MRSVDAGACPPAGRAKPYLSEQQPGDPFCGAGTSLETAWAVVRLASLYVKSAAEDLMSS